MRRFIGITVLLVCGGAAEVARAEPADGVTPTVLSRGTYEEFKVKADSDDFDFKAKAQTAMDIVVRRHEYDVGSTTGWHAHPGPVFITVIAGTLTVYEWDDPTCTPIVLRAGETYPYPNGDGYVDSGSGHVVRNESGAPAVDVSVITAPVGGAFRTDLPKEQQPSACPF